MLRFKTNLHMYTLWIYTAWCNYGSEQFQNTFHEPTTYEPHVKKCSKQIITFAGHEYGRVGVFRIEMRSLGQNS